MLRNPMPRAPCCCCAQLAGCTREGAKKCWLQLGRPDSCCCCKPLCHTT